MLTPLCRRGPDSAGVAVFGKSRDPLFVLRVKLGERGNFDELGRAVADQLRGFVPLHEQQVFSEYLRVVVGPVKDPLALEQQIEGLAEGLELVSMGRQLEIAKQVGSPSNLEESYHIRSFRGTHGIGHTRLSTESRVDLSHSQPFWARGVPDLATVHNGHITNYHKLRRQFEQKGYRFYTENDSEIIGIYLRDRIERGASLEEALWSSVEDFDGSFCYLVASGNSLAYVKDPFALKPLMVAESPDAVAVATEEIGLRPCMPGSIEAFEPGARQVHVWSVPRYAMETV
jgi:glutamate synthase domain-containing protein 1